MCLGGSRGYLPSVNASSLTWLGRLSLVVSSLNLAACSSGMNEAQRPASRQVQPPAPAIASKHVSAAVAPVSEDAASGAPAYAYPSEKRPQVNRAPVLPENTPRPDSQAPHPALESDFLRPLPGRILTQSAPANQHANLAPWQCRQLLKRWKLPFNRDTRPTPGVATAVRTTGTLHGVTFHAPGRKSPYGALDCRLALTLASFAQVLKEHDVVWVRVDNMWRPNARLPGRRNRPSQHSYGLAIDIMEFETEGGMVLNVEEHFHGRRGEPPCGPEAKVHSDEERAVRLRNLICDVARRGIFHHMLTPNYDAAHRDHFHLDVKRDSKSWMIK